MKALLFFLLLVSPLVGGNSNTKTSLLRACNNKTINCTKETKQTHRDTLKEQEELFDKVISLIKQKEGWHGPKLYPYVGYGHKILPSDNLVLPISKKTAEKILRRDLRKKMFYFKEYPYKQRLLLGMLAYNVGQNKLIKNGKPNSTIARILLNKNFNRSKALKHYRSWRLWNGKITPSIEKRRVQEFNLVFPK